MTSNKFVAFSCLKCNFIINPSLKKTELETCPQCGNPLIELSNEPLKKKLSDRVWKILENFEMLYGAGNNERDRVASWVYSTYGTFQYPYIPKVKPYNVNYKTPFRFIKHLRNY